MAKLTRGAILKAGVAEIDVMRSGSRQKVDFRVVREETPAGKIPYLSTDRIVDLQELLRIAAEFDIPVKAPSGKFFPPGKKATDFAKL